MTETEGMTFTIVTCNHSEKGHDKWLRNNPFDRFTEDDFIITKTPYVVPNGRWVMKGVSGDIAYQQNFFGSREKIERIVLERHAGVDDVLWVSDEPFGKLSWHADGDTWLPTGGIHFMSAKQVHKGQLGQLVEIPKLKYVREDKPEVKEWARGKRKNRSHVGWGKVFDLVKATELSFEEIIERFWPFVDTNSQPWHRFPATLKVLFGVTAEEIKARRRSVLELTKQEIIEYLQEDPDALNDVWIPEGLIKTILRLTALGYKPVRMANA